MIDAKQPKLQASIEFHIDDICKFLESKNSIKPLSPVSNVDEKLRSIKEWVFKNENGTVVNNKELPM